MIPGGIGLQPGQSVVSQAQKLLEQAPGQLQEFEQVLASLEQSDRTGLAQDAARAQGTSAADGPGPAKVIGPEEAEGLYARKLEEAQEPGGVRKLLGEVEAGAHRLEDLLGQLQGGRTFNAQELLGIQAEIQQVSLQVETTTKVVSEVVSSVKQLMQQQI
jgi:hypothetical protein